MGSCCRPRTVPLLPSRRALWIALLTLAASAAVRAEITGASVPADIWVNDPFALTVQGVGPCPVDIVWEPGDSESLPPSPLPLQVQHAYASAGAKTIEVTSADCKTPGDGPIELPVIVKSDPLGELCAVSECGVDPAIVVVEPTITGVLGAVGSPGRVLIIGGEGFLATPGEVRLENGAGETIAMDVLEWHPGGIGVQVPASIAELCEPPFELRVRNAVGRHSDAWPVAHLTGYAILPRGHVSVLHCDDDANWNHCNHVDADGDWCGWGKVFADFPDFGESTFGNHTNCPLVFGDDTGEDLYRATVQTTGWTLLDAHFDRSSNAGWATNPGDPSPGATQWTFDVRWSVPPGCALSYGLDIVVSGPECRPYQ